MRPLARPIIFIAIVVGIAVGAVAGLRLVTRGTSTTESATTVLRKSAAAQAQLLAPLGPNTTYHVVTVKHQASTIADASGVADDTTTDLFMTFDSTGMLNTFWQVSRGPDGQVFQRGDWIAGKLIFTNTQTGKITAQIGYGRFSATDVGQRLSDASAKAIEASTSARARTATVAGIPAYVIETPTNRTYIAKSDYRVLKSEQLAPDGHVTEYTMQTVQEVLSGIVTESP